jgi:hypothetical protein
MTQNRLVRWKLTLVLSALGAAGGALAAVVLTYAGNRLAGAPWLPTVDVYIWNARIFAVIGAVASPALAWGLLRSVPLWRAVAEPAAAALAGTVLSVALAPSLFALITPAAVIGALWRLRIRYASASAPSGQRTITA